MAKKKTAVGGQNAGRVRKTIKKRTMKKGDMKKRTAKKGGKSFLERLGIKL